MLHIQNSIISFRYFMTLGIAGWYLATRCLPLDLMSNEFTRMFRFWFCNDLELIMPCSDGRKCYCCFFLFLIHHLWKISLNLFLRINRQAQPRMAQYVPFARLLQPFLMLLYPVITGTSLARYALSCHFIFRLLKLFTGHCFW